MSKLLAFSLALFAVPCLASAADLQNEKEILSISGEQKVVAVHCSGGDKRKCHHDRKPLTLSDFAGDWVYSTRTVGGLSGADRIGDSAVIDGQVTFDDSGNGAVNFTSGAIYSGTVGTVLTFTINPNTATATIAITDSVNGIATLIITDPTISFSETSDVIVRRSLRTGVVTRFEGHSTSVNPTTGSVASYVFLRQFE